MLRAVLDVNVLVSGFPAANGIPAEILARWLSREFILVLSEHILEGTLRAWNNDYFLRNYPHGESLHAIRLLRERALMVEPADTLLGVAIDKEDDLVLATAVTGAASFLVTGDRRFRAIETYKGIQLVTPREFLIILQHET